MIWIRATKLQRFKVTVTTRTLTPIMGTVIRAVFMFVDGGWRGGISNFERLVLGCIEADFCKEILVGIRI